jgi:hypothetical protein
MQLVYWSIGPMRFHVPSLLIAGILHGSGFAVKVASKG